MRKLMKNICFVFLFAFCAFFMNAIDVKAVDSCSCYYVYQRRDAQPEEIAVAMNTADGTYGSPNIYYYEVKFNNSGSPNIYSKITYVDVFDMIEGTIHQTNDSYTKNVEGVKIDDEFKANNSVLDNNCSIESCKNANIGIDTSSNFKKIVTCTNSNCQPLTTVDSETYSNAEEGINTDTNSFVGYTGEALEAIKKWGSINSEGIYGNNDSNPCDIINDSIKDILSTILRIISIVGIILLIIMSMIEFVKALTGANDDLIKTAFKHTVIRIACAILLFLLPIIITWIINIINDNNILKDENNEYIIGANGQPLCNIEK